MTRVRPSLTSCVADEHRSGNGRSGGADRDRTDDLRLAKPALSQLSYSPENWSGYRQDPIVAALVGLGRLELPTSRLSGVRSNRLSYRPPVGKRLKGERTRSLKTE